MTGLDPAIHGPPLALAIVVQHPDVPRRVKPGHDGEEGEGQAQTLNTYPVYKSRTVMQ